MHKWTILIYANGNNELEPEVWQSKKLAEKIGSNDEVNVLMQIAREERKVVSILRPDFDFEENEESWSGVKRLFIKDGYSDLIENLGKVNMAHPLELYNFIKWGINNYPAEHYLLLLGGHGWQFIGTNADYSQELPYMMGMPELSDVINNICIELNVYLDLLILDICYFNFFEVIYELGKHKDSRIKKMLSYIGDGPIEGLSLNNLIESIRNNTRIENSIEVTKNIIKDLNHNLVVFEINHSKLVHIKSLFNELGNRVLLAPNDLEVDSVLYDLTEDNPNYDLVYEIHKEILSLIIHYKELTSTEAGLIEVATQLPSSKNLLSLYYRLDYAKNNSWINAISDCTEDLSVNSLEFGLQPMILSPNVVKKTIMIMNPSFELDDIDRAFEELVEYKKWITKN